MSATLGAIVLAGGRATRLDGVDKPALEVGGISLLERAVAAAQAAGAASVVIVGPPGAELPHTVRVQEQPAFAGPAAAIVAGLGALETAAGRAADAAIDPAWFAAVDAANDPEWMLVLAADLARPDAAVARLVADLALLPADTDGVCLADGSSRPQWLTGAYRTASLRRAAKALPDAGRDAPVRALLDDLSIAVFRVPDDIVHDVDTWQDLEQARRLYDDTANAQAVGGPSRLEEETP
ncbi:NTP transferase domain-containing protein [Microbacterium sp. cx-55]|uniref:molybdenum cofactor guanylyltransferase n=1 Tax=Microbacterium sp. cx-55 TaxID=2875948 RepID=UPI001CBE03E2|nr:NTP transferase domain-containing protein [Microbacterium sp. cx-55]MBZ4487955.1 NTP transferase domain-containing protein [Microbacterium sp. cx-55]UGB34635.1 NTP transferase domain-containing protein [Microbacterium sp. cx-55]